jgi:hypothetical protein
MVTTAGTTPTDVRVEIDTILDDPEIGDLLDRVEREVDRTYSGSSPFSSTQHRVDFEAALAALRIAEGRDRRGEETQSGRSSVTYEASEVAGLRKRVRRRDPGSEFGRAGMVARDSARHVTQTDQ